MILELNELCGIGTIWVINNSQVFSSFNLCTLYGNDNEYENKENGCGFDPYSKKCFKRYQK